MQYLNANTVFWALIGGILPALLWLWFWLHEDDHPEPRRLILIAFLGGMLAVPLVVPFQLYLANHLANPQTISTAGITTLSFIVVMLWAGIEELFKYLAAHFTALIKKEDEPLDIVMFMLTTALGFSALENVIFIVTPIQQGLVNSSIITGNLRFIGASLLHIVSSSTIGISLALAFYKSRRSKFLHWAIGFVIAVALHTFFNLIIMENNPNKIVFILFFVWLSVVVLALFFEKIKAIRPPCVQASTPPADPAVAPPITEAYNTTPTTQLTNN